jgi:LAS superfamily LD-carboxypeptidase LdcB
MHQSGSLDYKVINPIIRNILDIRSELNNTVQIAMPFVKATTTIGGGHVPELNSGVGFTLGLHSIDQDVKYEDIYASQDGTMPLLGYTYVDGKTQRIYARNPDNDIGGQIFAGKIFDKRAGLFNNTPGYVRFPPPGITNVTIGRAKNGLLAQAQLTISIPSLLQLESLHRLFLVPGVGMVLEWGQQFANDGNAQFGETGILNDLSVTKGMFPWYDTNETLRLFRRLAENDVSVQEIIDKYVIPSQGQYMWMFGRVANFNINSLSDGSFQATVKIVGPSEDSWAYSTKNTVIPTKDPSYKYFCASETNSVYSYFADTAIGGINLKTLLDKTMEGNGGIFSQWKGHVTKFTPENKPEDPKPEDKNPNTNEVPFLEGDDAYFMTWRFFVNVVLNDLNYGVKRIFAAALDSQTLNKVGMLQPYATGPTRQNTNVSALSAIDDPMESFIGYNKYLRSIDPSTMIIVNENAAKEAENNKQYNISKESKEFLEIKRASEFSGASSGIGKFRFDISAQAYNTESDPTKHDRGFLSTGVWVNHRAVVESMIGGDTIVKGITNLLERMNQATLNYWQLTLDVSEPIQGTSQKYNYMVVDSNYRENSYNAVSKFIDNVHTFNKYTRIDKTTGKLVGSELIECNIDLSLPKRLFSQIATLGLVQPGDLEKAGVDVQGSFDYTNSKTPKLSDPNDTLRTLYSTLVINPAADTEQGPDLTILPRNQQTAANGICGQQNVQTTAQTAGNSAKAGNIPATYEDKSLTDLESIKKDSESTLKKQDCILCEQCSPTGTAESSNLPVGNEVTYLSPSNEVQRVAVDFNYEGETSNSKALFAAGYRNGRLGSSVLKSTRSGQLLYKEAADAFDRMALAASTATPPINLGITSAYRTLSSQAELVKTKGLFSGPPVLGATPRIENGQPRGFAGTPGRSNHGWGLAVDFVQNDASRQWLLQNSERFGFKFAELTGEPWHWEYVKPFEEPIPPAPVEQSAQTTSTTSTPTATAKTTTGTVVKCEDVLKRPATTFSAPGGPGGAPAVMTSREITACDECQRAKTIVNQTSTVISNKKETQALVEKALRDFPSYRNIFRYVEIFPEYMVAQITDSSNGSFSNAFGAAPGSLSISGDLVMPGINGLRVGELFWIDKIPAFYKVFGAFQIMSIEDKIEVSGWKTQINARFNFLGTEWRKAMGKKLGE